MAPPQDYTTMPWTLRSLPPPESVSDNSSETAESSDSDESTGSLASSVALTATAASRLNHELLLTQLAASHSAQRRLEERLEDQKRDFDARLEQQKRESERYTSKLEQDLAQCQKREEAIKAVFFREFEKERALMLEDRRLKLKAEALARKSYRLNDKAEQLERKRTNTAQEVRNLEATLLQLEESIALHRGDSQVSSEAVGLRNPSHTILMHAAGNTYPFSYGNVSLLHLDKVRASASTTPSNDKAAALLRRHDYYTGWFHAMRSLNHRKAIVLDMEHSHHKRSPARLLSSSIDTKYLQDLNNPHNPRNAGINAGLLFAYSALCKQHNLTESRLDTREWTLDDIKPVARENHAGDFAFWDGMDYAVDKMKRLFKLKIERGIWKTGDDAAQITLMRARDVPRGYVVEERPPHWTFRRHANTVRDV
ncbi:hypothetical protein HBI56_067270 [Parastagonospora nodorum]|nr:hypothetical protein HBH51_245740 [Parastagonospora nodorum]KAH4035756.1 hypothetical protein HBI09_091350 [Parastagonospora nodorum]KAH4105695.1 hypothetical protein HBH46_083600 [Parastagonospora nodorum]KAH4936739.1 hypothetical protein HBI79_070960 [Parastagonospora nodorum]KAH5019112.1 hypothetical protein HBI77_043800 [Parastagonospora nodorum]